jgi:phosphonopyruvate decarboxylase
VSHASLEATQNAKRFLALLQKRSYGFFTGVPCSLLSGLFTELETNSALDYVSAVREDVAIGLAAGAHLAGKKTAVLMQNSGLGVCYNALASMSEIYEIPTLIVVSWRGEGGKDAPEHIRMGKVITRILEELEIPYLVADALKLEPQMAELDASMEKTHRPAALIVSKGVFA